MTTNYQGNSRKAKEVGQKAAPPEKNIQKVVSGEVKTQKQGLGKKFKSIVAEADLRTVVNGVISDVLIPAMRNMIVDSTTKGIERMIYGESTIRRRGYSDGPRITYNSPINRGYRDVPSRLAPTPTPGPRRRTGVQDVILADRTEADVVLERMNDIIDNYEFVSVADLNELVGLPSSHVDQKWGWVYMGDAVVRQVREGYLLDLPPAEPIS